jgi:hypothetical protein
MLHIIFIKGAANQAQDPVSWALSHCSYNILTYIGLQLINGDYQCGAGHEYMVFEFDMKTE